MPEDMIGLAAALMERWNAHDADGAAHLCAPDYEGVDVAQAAPQRGPEGMRQTVSCYVQAFPDVQFTALTLADGNRAALFWTARGTHLGAILHIPATGRPIEIHGVTLLTVRDCRITHGLSIWDVAGLLRTIGLLPEL